MELDKLSKEEMLKRVAKLSRRAVTRELVNFKGPFKMDFDEKFCQSQPVERLRHILAAAILHTKKK